MPVPNPDLLAEEAFAWVIRRASLRPQVPAPDPGERWVLRSNLQKAIRRGLCARSRDLALSLHALDAPYTWRTIQTVALEDIGLCSPESVLFSCAAGVRSFREAVGEVPLLLALVQEMCESPKSRTACDLSYLVDEAKRDLLRDLCSRPSLELLDLVASEDPYACYGSLVALRGRLPKEIGTRPRDLAAREQALDIMHEQLAPRHARAAQLVFSRPLDNMALAYFPSARLAQNGETVAVTKRQPPPAIRIAGYDSPAFDQHERVGRQALKAFTDLLGALGDLPRGLPAGKARAAVGDAVFLDEGSALNSYVCSPGLRQVRDLSETFTLARHGLSEGEARQLRRAVIRELSELNRLRILAAHGAL